MKCRECEHMQVKRTMYGVGCCRECYCRHPRAEETYKGKRAPGFIGYTEMDGRTIRIKTCPRWCPGKGEGK